MRSAGIAIGGADERDAHTVLAQMRQHTRMKQLIVRMSQRDHERSRSSHDPSAVVNPNLRTWNHQNLEPPEPAEPSEPACLSVSGSVEFAQAQRCEVQPRADAAWAMLT